MTSLGEFEYRDHPAPWQTLMKSRVVRNEALSVQTSAQGELEIRLPLRKLNWLVPPLSWVFPTRESKLLRLDGLGSEVFRLCQQEREVQWIVDAFAERHRLTFHESRVAVTQYVRSLVERRVLILVGSPDKLEEK